MFRRLKERYYRQSVRQVVALASGVPVELIPLKQMPKNDDEFENLVINLTELQENGKKN